MDVQTNEMSRGLSEKLHLVILSTRLKGHGVCLVSVIDKNHSVLSEAFSLIDCLTRGSNLQQWDRIDQLDGLPQHLLCHMPIWGPVRVSGQ